MAVFDLGDDQALFESIKIVYNKYRNNPIKYTEDLLYVIMGLNHLREWISPDFNPDRNGSWPTVENSEQEFSKKIYDDQYFKIIRALCNSTKHAKRKVETDTQFERNVLEWPDFLRVANMHTGPPTEHRVNGRPIDEIIDLVIDQYGGWFSSRPKR